MARSTRVHYYDRDAGAFRFFYCFFNFNYAHG